jgi:hypothetical protein
MKSAEPSSAQIVLRVPPALRGYIENVAGGEGRTLANLTRQILTKWAVDHRQTTEAPHAPQL